MLEVLYIAVLKLKVCWYFNDIGRSRLLLVFDRIDERPLSGLHVCGYGATRPTKICSPLLLWSFLFVDFAFFWHVFSEHWNPEIVCCVYFHPSRLVEIPRGLNLRNISHISLKNPTSATLCMLLLTDF